MNSKHRLTFGSVASVLLAGLLGAPRLAAATPEKNEIPIRWAVRADAPAPANASLVKCTRVRFDVDVYGGTATGTLTYEFQYDGKDPATVRFESTLPSRFEVLGMAVDPGRRYEDLAIERVAVKSDAPAPAPPAEPSRFGARSVRAEAPTDSPAATSVRSAPFEIAAESAFEARARFFMPLSLEHGTFGLTLPAVEQERSREAERSAPPDTAARVTTTVHHDAPLLAVASATHEVLTSFLGDRTVIEPVVPEFPASRSFQLTFATSSAKEPTLAGRVRRDGDNGHTIEIVLDPPPEPAKTASRAKQMLFVVDTSGSMMMGDKIGQARRAVERALGSLQPTDRFNVIEFSDSFTLMRPAPIEPVAAGDDTVEHWLEALTARGGTTLLPALAAALDQPDDPNRHRIIVLVTDGWLQDEGPVLKLLKERLGERRLFVVGAGPMMRQDTLLRLAEYGRGGAAFFGDSANLEETVDDLSASISDPLAWDLKLDWDGGDVTSIEPSRLPDLYAGRPVRLLARVRGDLPSSLAVTVSTVDGDRRYRVSLPPIE